MKRRVRNILRRVRAALAGNARWRRLVLARWKRWLGGIEWEGEPSIEVPLRCDGAGKVFLGRSVALGFALAPRLADGEVTLQARYPDSRIGIGSGTHLSNNVTVIAVTSVTIGRDCLVGDQVVIFDSDFHHLDPVTRNAPNPPTLPVTVGDRVWIGSRAMLLKGVRVGDNSVIAAGAVVVADVPANSIVGGVPARVIGTVPGTNAPTVTPS